MINGVVVKKLTVHSDERGLVMEFLRSDDRLFEKFGQVYLTLVKMVVAKGWHFHKKQVDHFVCVEGKALVALYDQRKDSPTFGQVQDSIIAAPDASGEHLLIKIPSGVVHGFAAYKCPQAKIVNIPTELYNYNKPDEFRYPWDSPEIPYHWPKEIKTGG